jgi:DNA-directed RNA polymerase specialized sigma24 family protein
MSSNQQPSRIPNPSSASKRNAGAAVQVSPRTSASGPDPAANDNGTRRGVRDTTALVASTEVVDAVRAVLHRHGINPQDMADAIAEVQTRAIETSRTRGMPRTVAQWKALSVTIAAHWARDRLREDKARAVYDVGLCDEADSYQRPTFRREEEDLVDTKVYLAALEDLFEGGLMPERGAEILWAEAEEISHKEIAREIGVSTTVVDNRLSRMRAKFRAKIAALGLLVVVSVLVALLSPMSDVVAPAPRTIPAEAASPACDMPEWDGAIPACSKNRTAPSEEIAPFPFM